MSGVEYAGSKWGPYLRAPDLYFELLEQARERCVQLETIARVTYGIKSGADAFFYLRDVTDAELRRRNADEQLAERFGLTRQDLSRRRLRLVRGLGRLLLPIEKRFLKPILFNLMEVSQIQVDETTTRRRALIVEQTRRRLRGTHLHDYILHGEREGIHNRPTVANRVTSAHEWYELRPARPATILWSQAHQYRHIVPYNPDRCLHNKRFFSIHVHDGVDDRLLCAVLNSTFVCFYKLYLGRLVGREGIIDTDVSAIEEMWVPDVRAFSERDAEEIIECFDELSSRPIEAMAPRGDELSHDDRRRLDTLVLRAIGLTEPEETRDRLYDDVVQRFGETRRLEEIAMANRARAARAGRGPSPAELADEVIESLSLTEPLRFPDDFLPAGAQTEIVTIPDGAEPVVGTGLFTDQAGSTAQGSVRFGSDVIELGDTDRAEFAAEIARAGLHGDVAVPVDSHLCRESLADWRAWQEQTRSRVQGAVEERTGNERLQRRTLALLDRRVFSRA